MKISRPKRPTREEIESWPLTCKEGEPGVYLTLKHEHGTDNAILELRYWMKKGDGNMRATVRGVLLHGEQIETMARAYNAAYEQAKAHNLKGMD